MTGFTYRTPADESEVRVVCGAGVLRAPSPKDLPRTPRGVLVVDSGALGHLATQLEGFVRGLVADPAPSLVIAGGEKAKDAAQLPRLWEELQWRNLNRGSLIVVAGGGAVLDLGLFLAATHLRGVAAVAVPTTLLSQVDAGLGGKCGVNLGGAKNQVGAIRQPAAIVVDPSVLDSLPETEWRSGLGEVMKTALLAGGGLLERVRASGASIRNDGPALESVIDGCLRHKAAVVGSDPQDRGLRFTLNLGHSVGHVLEGLAAAGGALLPHGLAVAAGILAEAREFLPVPGVLGVVEDLLRVLGLPSRLEVPFDADLAAVLAGRDKKGAEGRIRLPVLEAPGRPVFKDATVESVVRAARDALAGTR